MVWKRKAVTIMDWRNAEGTVGSKRWEYLKKVVTPAK
jgi:hypothetical protein